MNSWTDIYEAPQHSWSPPPLRASSSSAPPRFAALPINQRDKSDIVIIARGKCFRKSGFLLVGSSKNRGLLDEEEIWGGIFAQNMQILSQISFAEISLPSKCQKKLLSMLESFQWKFQWKEDLYSRNLFQIVFSPYLPISLFISQKVFRVPALKPTVNSSSRFDFFQMKKIIENSVNYVWRLSIRKKLSLLCRWEPENSRLSDNCREKTLAIYFFSSDPLIVATNVWSTNLNTYM